MRSTSVQRIRNRELVSTQCHTNRLLFRVGLLACVWLALGMTQARAEDAPVADAAERADDDAVRRLVAQGADLRAPQADGMTAIHWAAYHDATEQARTLLAAGADAGAASRYGLTPLAFACQNGNPDLVALLLEHGADPNAALPGNETALMTAARTGRLEPIRLLLARGADVQARERKGQTALMWAAAEGHADVVDALLAAGADPLVQLDSGFTACFFAIRAGQLQAAQRLLRGPVGVNDVMTTHQGTRFGKGPWKLTPLLLAVENGHFELAKMLLDLGADPNANPSGYTALHALTWVRKPIRGDGDPPPAGSGRYESLDMTRMLVEAGADINARVENGKSGLGRFTYTGSTPFVLAAQTADLPMLKLLAELGADIQLTNADGTTPLLAAAGVGALSDGDESAGTEPEVIAAVEYLLDQGADIHAVDANGETAMHGAAYQSFADLAGILLRRGSDPQRWNRENRAGWTPLVIAMGYRPGNFRPSPETVAVIQQAMTDAGLPLPDPASLGKHRRNWP